MSCYLKQKSLDNGNFKNLNAYTIICNIMLYFICKVENKILVQLQPSHVLFVHVVIYDQLSRKNSRKNTIYEKKM